MKRAITTIFLPLIAMCIVLYLYLSHQNFKYDNFIYFYTLYYVIFCFLPYIGYLICFKENSEKHLYYTVMSSSLLMIMIPLLIIAFILLLILNFQNFNILVLLLVILVLISSVYQVFLFLKSIFGSIRELKKDELINKRMDKFFKLGLKLITFIATTISLLKYFSILTLGGEYIAILWGITLSFLSLEIFIYNLTAIIAFHKILTS